METAKRTGTRGPRISAGLGLLQFPFETIAGFWRWVDLCESGGIDSLWQSDRIVSREPMLESLSVMAALAGRTRRLKFGMNVVSMALRDPVLLAKQCATIDVLSEGRLLPAFGIGSAMAPEWQALGIDPKTRGARSDEGLEILRLLWTGEPVDFAGEHYRLAGASIAPRPVQAELPMWIGGSSAAAIRRTARFGTGWQAGGETPEQIVDIIANIRAGAAEFGREIDEGHYGTSLPFWLGDPEDPGLASGLARYSSLLGRRNPLKAVAVGNAQSILDRMAAYIQAGISKFILLPMASGDDDTLGQTRRIIEELLPALTARWPRGI